MADRIAASAGVVVAALALLGSALPGPAWWRLPAVAVAGLAVAGFALRRWGVTERRPGAALAGLASVAVGAVGLAGLLWAAGEGTVPAGGGPWALAGLGLVATVAAYADWAAIPPAGLAARATSALFGLAVGVSGFVGIFVWANVLAVLVVLVSPTTPDAVGRTAISALGLGLGTATVGLLYLRLADRPLSYIDFRVPDLRDVGYTVVGVFALLGSLVVLSVAFAALGVSAAEHSTVEQARQNPDILLVLIPAAWLLIGPGEELLYRNVVQKSLYDAFSRPAAVLVASVVFAAAHFLAYYDPNYLRMLPPLSIVFALSVILGVLYERTENTLVPAFVHGTFDAVLFISLYLSQTMDSPAAGLLP